MAEYRQRRQAIEVPLGQGASVKSLCRVSRPISKTQPSAWRLQVKGDPADRCTAAPDPERCC
jgi:hypothetical protein